MAALAPLRNTLLERAADAWFTLDEAAVYCSRRPKSIRNAMHRRELAADGRGARRTPLFRKATLDAYIARGEKGGAS